jgi:hypothetical protein
MEKPNDPIGNRTRGLSPCSAGPQPTALSIKILDTTEGLSSIEMYSLKHATLVHSKHSDLKHRVKNLFDWNLIP